MACGVLRYRLRTLSLLRSESVKINGAAAGSGISLHYVAGPGVSKEISETED